MGEIRKIYTEGCLELKEILDFSMEHQFEEHGTAYLKAELEDEKILNEVADNNPLTICMDTELGKEILFCGNIQEISVYKTGQSYGVVEIRLISNTIQLDKEKVCQSFQNVALTYEQLADKVTESKAALFWNADTTSTIGKPLIQYYETDWEFLKRISSHLNAKIFADIQAAGIGVHVGCDSGREPHEIDSLSSRIGLSEQYFLHKGRSQREFMYYSIVSEENLPLGRTIKFASKKLIIFKKRAYLDGSRVLFTYDAGGAAFGENPIFFNRDFIGRVIKGEVLSTKNETLRIKMEIDAAQNESEAYDYEWQPESGNVMYCMPQVGTMVSLYFGDWDERAGRIINCIRTNGGDCEDMSDPNNKTLTTEYNKRLMMNEEVLVLNSNITDETASLLSLEDAGGVIVKSKSNLTVLADGLLRIEGKNIIIDTPKKISCGQGVGEDGNTESSLVIEEDVDMVAEEVKYELTVIYLYPNIMDAPEECSSGWEIFGKVLLGVVIAAAAALAVAALVVMTAGAAAALSATAAAAIASAGGFGTVFGTAFFAGTLAGGTAAVAMGIEENSTNSGTDAGEYVMEGMVNSAVTAFTAGTAFTASTIVAASSLGAGTRAIFPIVANIVDAEGSMIISNTLLGKEVSAGEILFNLFVPMGTTVGLDGFSYGSININGLHSLIEKAAKNEILQGRYIAQLLELAYGPNTSPQNIANYYNYLGGGHSFFNGTIPENIFNSILFVNKYSLASGETVNIASSVLPLSGEEAEKETREKYICNGTNSDISKEESEEKKKEHEESLKERNYAAAEYYVTRGAELRCTCGTHMRRLDVVEDEGYRVANTAYYHPYIGECQCIAGETQNIKNFGICNGNIKGETITLVKDPTKKDGGSKNRVTGVRCVPNILGKVWFDTNHNISLKKEGELVTGKSFLACSCGGFIEIFSAGEEYLGEQDDGEIIKKELDIGE